jgi:hypothetical protein
MARHPHSRWTSGPPSLGIGHNVAHQQLITCVWKDRAPRLGRRGGDMFSLSYFQNAWYNILHHQGLKLYVT